MQTGHFLGKLSQYFINNDDKNDSKAAFENLDSVGTGHEKVQNQSETNMYETNYSHYVNHRKINQETFEKLEGINLTEDEAVHNEIDINSI